MKYIRPISPKRWAKWDIFLSHAPRLQIIFFCEKKQKKAYDSSLQNDFLKTNGSKKEEKGSLSRPGLRLMCLMINAHIKFLITVDQHLTRVPSNESLTPHGTPCLSPYERNVVVTARTNLTPHGTPYLST